MWKLPALDVKTAYGAVDTEVVGVFQDADRKPASPAGPYKPLIERFRKSDAFVARSNSTQFVRFGGKNLAESVLFVGLGTAGELTDEKIRQAGGSAWGKLNAEKVKTFSVSVDSLLDIQGLKPTLTPARVVRVFAEGLILSAYQWRKYKTKAAQKEKKSKEEYLGPTKITFVTQDKSLKKQIETELEQVEAIGECVNVTRDWSNEPSNYGTPEYFAGEAQKLAKQYGVKCTILTEKDAAREKMGLFLGVGQGSEREGRIVVLEYTPKASKGSKTVALVGKGITFDSGGISIKPSTGMEEMKHDMTGAATMMGATLLAARWKCPNRIVTILAFTENMPDGDAIQPGNVLTSRSGKTVEVINTDAEGRLILADVLDYAHDFKPDVIVNAATLTGAVGIALGKHCCGVMGNDDNLIETLRRIGDETGERAWPLPLFDEYFEDMKSDSADMKNSVNNRYGGTIRGGIFLKQFIRKGVRWAHLDIATTANDMGHLPYYPKKGASGAHVRTLAQFACEF